MRTTTAITFTLALLVGGLAGCGQSGDTVKLQGAGASFPAPIYDYWFKAYNQKHPNVQVDYQSVGSGSGVKSFINQEVDFGASDAAMSPDDIAKVPESRGVVLLPMTAGSIVLAYHPDLPKGLKLPREVYTGMFLGEVTNWNDARIAEANPGVSLPDLPIQVVRRADGSGTTYVFTKHLAELRDEWKNGPGVGKSIDWPVGIGAKKNDGVAAQVQSTPGAIGYMEYGFARNTKLPMAALENKAGKYIVPSGQSAANALATIPLPADMIAWGPDPEGDDAYPIVTYTWIMAYKKYDDAKKAEALRNVLKWCLTEGQSKADELGYVPLPENVASKVAAALDKIQ